MSIRIYKERRVYFFTCTECEMPNCQSYKRSRAKRELCRNCRRTEERVDENQLPLLGIFSTGFGGM